MITETFLKLMVGGTVVTVLVAIVVLVVKLQRHQKDDSE